MDRSLFASFSSEKEDSSFLPNPNPPTGHDDVWPGVLR
jgi:hypothetical protein